jgi:two-component system response regulator AtoC
MRRFFYSDALRDFAMGQKRILVVDDEALICWSLANSLDKAGYLVETAGSAAEAREKLSFHPHAVLLDIRLPDASGLEMLKEFRVADEDLAFLMITADANVDTAVQALRLGADDFIGKPFDLERVKHALHQIFEQKQLKKQVACLRRRLRKKEEGDQLIGNSRKMIELAKMIRVCAETDCRTVLILGESGTGKELVARAIHQYSARADEPLLDINCSAIPENLLENELFGHEKGAFTDASDRQKGIFELAEGGTVFLDEIGDMPLSMQAKILRVIETKRYRRLGGKEDLQANVRIIAATNQNLPAMVRDGRFRGDLFFRLNVMSLDLAPLRERKEDIPKIVQYFITRLNDEYGRSITGVTPEAMADLIGYDWPGNVRELRNAVERAMMLEGGRLLTPDHLPCEIRQRPKEGEIFQRRRESSAEERPFRFVLPLEGISMEEVEKEFIHQALERHNGNQTMAARCLRISRDTLRYRMKKFGLGEPDSAEANSSTADELEPVPGKARNG